MVAMIFDGWRKRHHHQQQQQQLTFLLLAYESNKNNNSWIESQEFFARLVNEVNLDFMKIFSAKQ